MLSVLACLAVSGAALAQAPAKCVPAELEDRLGALEQQFATYQALRFGADARTLKRSMTSALEQQRSLEAAYQRVVAARCGRPSVRAAVMIGRTYEELATKFIESPAPKGLDADQVAMYRSELAARAAPMTERALAAFKDAVRQAEAQGIDDELVQLARARLAADAGR